MPSEYTPSVEERRQGAKAIEQALNQCGIAVRYAISGPRELFDVASVLLKSDFMAAHDDQVRAAERERTEESVLHTAPTWFKGMYGCREDMFSRGAIEHALKVLDTVPAEQKESN